MDEQNSGSPGKCGCVLCLLTSHQLPELCWAPSCPTQPPESSRPRGTSLPPSTSKMRRSSTATSASWACPQNYNTAIQSCPAPQVLPWLWGSQSPFIQPLHTTSWVQVLCLLLPPGASTPLETAPSHPHPCPMRFEDCPPRLPAHQACLSPC